jgi:hypothetical protein
VLCICICVARSAASCGPDFTNTDNIDTGLCRHHRHCPSWSSSFRPSTTLHASRPLSRPRPSIDALKEFSFDCIFDSVARPVRLTGHTINKMDAKVSLNYIASPLPVILCRRLEGYATMSSRFTAFGQNSRVAMLTRHHYNSRSALCAPFACVTTRTCP